MKRSISIVGSILLAAAVMSPAWAKPGKGGGGGGGGGGESQAGGLPALEDRVDADEALIATLQTQVSTLMSEVTALQGAVTALQGQNNWAVVDATCTVSRSNSSAGAVTSVPVSAGVCEVIFAKDVSACAYEATVGDTGTLAVLPAFINVSGDTDADSNHDVFVRTFNPAGTPTSFPFHLTVTCP
jgi:TolA-binding protein